MSPQGCEACCEPTLAGGHGMLAYPAAAHKKELGSNGIAKETVPTATVKASKAPQDLVDGLRVDPKHIPCRFLYDDVGSQLYEKITQLKEYYPYETERALLKAHAKDIVRSIPPGSVVTELGVGDGSKTSLLLEALLDRDGPDAVHFCGIDCSAEALGQCRTNLQRHCPRLSPNSLELIEAEYLAGVAEVRRRHPTATLCLLWLGSSVGNFAQDAAASLLHDLAAAAGGSMQLLLCTDLWKDRRVLHDAYDDPQGVTEAFIKNGMRHALRTLGQPEELAGKKNWTYDCVVNPEETQVEMWLVAHRAVPGLLPGSKVGIAAGERVLMEVSRKFTEPCIADLAFRAGLCIQAAWGNPLYRMTLLLPPREALQRCWADSDSLFSCIADWNAQPIGLRHPFCFYYGHNAAFTKLKLLPGEEPSSMDLMLSRGIDPNVLDPSLCHSHPDVPDAWPSEEQLLEYVSQTRAKVLGSLERLQQTPSSSRGSAPGMTELCMGLEHERMHQETLCYMMAQQRKRDYTEALQGGHKACIIVQRLPSGGVTAGQQAQRNGQQPRLLALDVQPYYLPQANYLQTAIGEEGSHTGSVEAVPAVPATPKGTPDRAAGRAGLGSLGDADESSGDELLCEGEEVMVRVPSTKVQLGLGANGRAGYVWDNELGSKEETVAPFLLASQPVTVEQFRDFILENKGYQRPELWDPADYRVLAASGQSMPATWSPDSFGDLVVHMPEASYPWRQVASCPAYVSLAEALAYARLHGARLLSEAEHAAACLHADSQAMAESGGGRGGDGCGRLVGLRSGGWEWTASLLEPFKGFQANPGYPEYSTDFFDGCHFVLKGSGPYTHPSMRRDSFRNFYQRQYPYVLAKFRLARDSE